MACACTEGGNGASVPTGPEAISDDGTLVFIGSHASGLPQGYAGIRSNTTYRPATECANSATSVCLRKIARVFSSVGDAATWIRTVVRTVQCPTRPGAGRHQMTVTQEAIIWTDPSDGYTIRVALHP